MLVEESHVTDEVFGMQFQLMRFVVICVCVCLFICTHTYKCTLHCELCLDKHCGILNKETRISEWISDTESNILSSYCYFSVATGVE